MQDVKERQTKVAVRRLAAAQKRALSEASRSGRIGDDTARELVRQVEDEAAERADLTHDE